ncbi:protein obstructor-E-like [Prorops nasuta]|uniref:protein obstructor-E-like n=1 Tax=Prorops nasuta TaxID=863751 RepID=UPI0034CF983A
MAASCTFFHLLIACFVFVAATPADQYQRYSKNVFFDNHLGGGHQVARQTSSGSCPEKNGRFPVPSQCDAYIECIDGVPEEKLCPEGLLFNPEARFNYPCGYPIDVNCEGRSQRQAAQPTNECPHQYGYFKVGDHQNCGQFMNCADGRGYIFDCPEGLAFNSETYRCDWPDLVPDCDAEAFLGFRCPEMKDSFYLPGEIRFYRSAHDCQHYYICVNNRPRLQSCGEGNAFNELINACDAAKNVTGCAVPESPEISDTRGQPIQLF